MNKTTEQQAIIDAKVDPGSALKAIAYAGTGKTSTLVELAAANPASDVLYLACNKSVAAEAMMRFPTNTLTKTGHALAYAAVGKQYRSNLSNIFNWQLCKSYGISLYEASVLLASLENFLNSSEDHPTEDHIQEDHLHRFPEGSYKEITLARVERLWKEMKDSSYGMPMTHSGYLKLFGTFHPKLPYDMVLLDEAQDTNPVMLRLMLDQMKAGAKVYFVGDPYQQIYTWRGALDAMTKIEAPEFYLTKSFRFGRNIAAFASKILSRMFGQQRPLLGHDPIEDSTSSAMAGPYTVICRTNAGLVQEAYSLAVSGKRLFVVGPDKFAITLSEIDDLFHLYSNKKAFIKSKRVAYHENYAKLKEYAEESLDLELGSKIGILDMFTKDWPKVKSTIEKALSVMEPEVTLTTCHKAKGLEWDNVRIGGDFTELHVEAPEGTACARYDQEEPPKLKKVVPNSTDKPDEIHAEEVNLLYVACTRAKRVLALTSDLRKL